VTFNTLVFTNELAAAEDYLRTIIAAGADAAIVQDAGICRMIRALSPDFPIHCSTQMTITSAAGVDFARELGAQLVVLARENSLAEIAKIQEPRPGAAPSLPLEVFVHGALCVAYSGQCLTSESLGGRSANRGECAQACRLPYELVADGQTVPLGDRRYLLSPQDLAGLDVLADLVRAGVASLKIEGRLKSPHYVASITRVYRQALDRVMSELDPRADGAGRSAEQPSPGDSALYELQMAFSRGLYPGWFKGINNQELVHARFGTKRGVFLGEVARASGESVALALAAPLKPGDGVVFDAGRPDEREEGGRVYQVETRAGETTLRFGAGDIDWRRVRAGQLVWKTSDPALDREVRATFEGDRIRFQRPITLEVHGRAGGVLTLIANDGRGHVVKLESAIPLAVAEHRPLTPERLRDQLGRLGGTPFTLGGLTSFLEGGVILPVSELNRLRREAVVALEGLRAQPLRWKMIEGDLQSPRLFAASGGSDGSGPARRAPDESDPPSPVAAAAPELIAVIRGLDQLDAAWAAGIRTIYCEFENPKHYRDAVSRFRELQGSPAALRPPDWSAPGASIWVAAPRIFKPGEEWILRQVRSCDADGYLVRNYDHLDFFAGERRRGDFSLNVANPWTADHFLGRHGLERVTASYDLNAVQLEALLRAAPGDRLDITIHQHMPMFHMEHCVFCAFLSTGRDYRDCGRPCDRHRVALRDRVGAELPLKADAGCRNTVYNNRAQTGAEYVARLLELGARSFRVEFVNESPGEVTGTLARYLQLVRGEITGSDLWREFKLLNQLGVTRGQMEAAPQALSRKM
jgi:putative protease